MARLIVPGPRRAIMAMRRGLQHLWSRKAKRIRVIDAARPADIVAADAVAQLHAWQDAQR